MKKISIALCLFFIMFSLQAQALGNVNNDGRIDMVDALLVAQYYVHIYNSIFNPNVADVNCDNRIDIVDAVLIAQYAVELISVFPCNATPTPSPTPIPTPIPTETPIPTDVPTPVPTPEPTDLPGTGEVRLIPATSNVNSGDLFVTAIDINAGSHEYAHYEFVIYFDNSLLTVNTAVGSAGVTIGTNGFISSVDASSSGIIRIIGDRSSGIPSTGENLRVNWIASSNNGGQTRLDLIVYVLADENNNTIGFPEGFPGYVNVTYTTPAPTPTPTPIPTATPAPDVTPVITAAPEDTPEPTATPIGEPGLVFFQPGSLTVNGGDFFTTALRIDTAPYDYGYYEFTIYYNNAYITTDTSQGNNGVTPGTNGFVTSVENSSGVIRIIGDGFSPPGTGEDDNLIIHWIAEYFISGTITLDLEVYDLRDSEGYLIGNPRGNDGTIEVIYAEAPTEAPTPDPTQTPVPTETPAPTETPITTPDPTPTPMPENMTVALELPTSAAWGGTNHWIPNTGEDFGPFRVKITAESSAGGNFVFTGDFEVLDILPPLDDNFDASETGDSNIKTNKGKCQYYLYARQTNENPQLIKIFQLNSGIMNNAARYETVFSATGADLKVGTGGYLYYDYYGTIYNYFTINAETGTGTIRPGDDLRLRFGLVYYPEFNEMVGAGEFLAIYDHRLLWRANAYINEGANDWNNLNPWNESTAVNPWNTSGTGRQVTLQPWTKWSDHTTVTDSVAYGWGNTDSIPTVKNKLTAQTTAISNYRLQNNEYGGIVWSNDSKAPGENWDNYLFPARIVNANNRWYYLATFTDEQLAPYLAQQHNYYVNGSTACIPGLTTFIVYCDDTERNPLPHNYEYSQTARSIGVDCAGFVCQSLLYPDNPYNVSGRIDAWSFAEDVNYSWPVDNINLLVPGDLLVMPDTPAHNNSHVVIVNRINYPSGARTIVPQSSNVFVIEATAGLQEQWRVMNTNAWAVLGSNYSLRRLRTNN